MLKTMFPALALGLATVPLSANAADDEVYHEGSLYRVLKAPDGCMMVGVLKSKDIGITFFSVDYRPRNKEVDVSFENRITTSLPDEGNVDMSVYFKRVNGLSSRFAQKNFSFYKDKDEGSYIFSTTFIGDSARHVLGEISTREHISFFRGDVIVYAFPLTGSQTSVAKLRECAFEVSGLNPKDPFAQ